MEGTPDQDFNGFNVRGQSSLISANSPLELIQTKSPDFIFASYNDRRDHIIRDIINGRAITGVWSETLFPAMKDLLRYGADSVKQSDVIPSLVQSATDVLTATLSRMIPQLTPLFAVLNNVA